MISPVCPHLFSARRSRWAQLGVLLVGLLFSVPPAGAGIYLTGGELSLQGTVHHEYDSNIFGNNQAVGDQHSVFTPHAKFVRDMGLLRLEADAGVRGHRFHEHRAEDSWDPFYHGALGWNRDDETKSEARFDAAWRRTNEANADVNTRTRSDELNVKADFTHFPLEKVGYKLTAAHFDGNQRSAAFSDLRTYDLDLEGRYQYTPKFDVLLGVGFRDTSTYYVPVGFPDMDSTDRRVKVGSHGQLLPKLTGQIALGWVQRRFRHGTADQQSGLLFDTSVAWRPDDDTTVSLLVKRDFDTTALDQSLMHLQVSLDARRRLHDKWAVSAGLSHGTARYLGGSGFRRDKLYRGQMSLDYQLTPRFRTEARASYTTIDSTRRISDFDRFIVGGALVATF